MVDATQKGVSLARNALAVAAKNLAEQELAAAYVALEEHAEPRYEQAALAAERAAHQADRSSWALAAQIGDDLLKRTQADALNKLIEDSIKVNGIMSRATETKERAVEAKLNSDVRAGTATLTQLAAAAVAGADLPEAEELEGLDAAVLASLDDDARRRAAKARAQAAAAEANRTPQGHRTATGELAKFGWHLVRFKGHPVYKRQAITCVGGKYRLARQSTTIPSTPSDRRSSANAVADINRANHAVTEVFALDVDVHGEMERRLSGLKSKAARLWKAAEGRSGSAELNNELGKTYDEMAGVDKIIQDISSG